MQKRKEKIKNENNELWELNDCYIAIPFKSKWKHQAAGAFIIQLYFQLLLEGMSHKEW